MKSSWCGLPSVHQVADLWVNPTLAELVIPPLCPTCTCGAPVTYPAFHLQTFNTCLLGVGLVIRHFFFFFFYSIISYELFGQWGPALSSQHPWHLPGAGHIACSISLF